MDASAYLLERCGDVLGAFKLILDVREMDFVRFIVIWLTYLDSKHRGGFGE